MYSRRMRLALDTQSPVPAVRQIADQLRVFLVEGSLKPGDALPSVRRVAMELSVHFNTVAEAYRQLGDEGWLELRHGRAALVQHRQAASSPPVPPEQFRTRLRGLVAEMRAQGLQPFQLATELRQIAEDITK
jgi:GntR family transcriptional regulator